jgi:hypothetical protein
MGGAAVDPEDMSDRALLNAQTEAYSRWLEEGKPQPERDEADSLNTCPWKGLSTIRGDVQINLFGTGKRYISCNDVPFVTPYQRSIVYDMAASALNALTPPGVPGRPNLLGD